MPLTLMILGIILIVVGILILFNIKKNSKKFANKFLSKYNDDDIVSEDDTKKLLETGIAKTISNVFLACVCIMSGIILIFISFLI